MHGNVGVAQQWWDATDRSPSLLRAQPQPSPQSVAAKVIYNSLPSYEAERTWPPWRLPRCAYRWGEVVGVHVACKIVVWVRQKVFSRLTTGVIVLRAAMTLLVTLAHVLPE